MQILIVDDSAMMRDILTQVVESAGYEVECAENGIIGIQKAIKNKPDLIILDVEMPKMKGYQACRFLKTDKRTYHIPIIILTTLEEERDKFWSLMTGADKYILKNEENFEFLLKTINELVNKELDIDPNFFLEDRGEGTSEDHIYLAVNDLLDRRLFQSTISNKIGEIAENVSSFGETIKSIFQLLIKVIQIDMASLIIKDQDTLLYMTYDYIPLNIDYKDEVKEIFFKELTNEFESWDKYQVIEKSFSNIPHDEKKRYINSSLFIPITLRGKEIGALLITTEIHNYFTEKICETIKLFIKNSSIVIDNSMLFKNMNDMSKKMNETFSKFLPQEVISEFMHKDEDAMLIGEKRNCAILFSDIRSFTELSESKEPEEIVELLNEYFSKMVSVIESKGGHIDKFIGDAILAIFGAPKSYVDNNLRAINAAIEMRKELDLFNEKAVKDGKTTIDIGIGIHSGEAIVGNIGSMNRIDYTVIGDTVNLASRLEGLTKEYQFPIVISDALYNTVKNDVHVREIDTVRVKGKEKPTIIYGVCDADSDYFKSVREFFPIYEKALQLYKLKQWTLAIETFQSFIDKIGDDYLSFMYIKRCQEYFKNPPEDNWDGVFTMLHK